MHEQAIRSRRWPEGRGTTADVVAQMQGFNITWPGRLHPMPQVEVMISYSPLAFIYALFRPNVEIDGGGRQPSRWGTHTIELPAGRHEIAISYPWLFSPDCGRNSVVFDLAAGETKRVRYRARLLRYWPGKMSVEGALPPARVVR